MAAVVGRHAPGLNQSFRGVCLVAPELDRIGGYELATIALARALRERGVSVAVVTITRGAFSITPADLIRINVRGRHTLLNTFPKLLAVLARERSRYSVIHCPTFSYISGLALVAGQILRRPTLVRVASATDVEEFADGHTLKTRLFFYILRQAARAIAPSIAIRDDLLRVGFSKQQVFYLPNSVDVDRFRPATPAEKAEVKSALGLAGEALVVGTVARLVEGKGIDWLLQAFGNVLRCHEAHLLVVGDGPLIDDFRTLANDLGIHRSVTWLGLQTDTNKWLRAMDVFALPSRLEGSPNAVLEAMATGLPIISTWTGGIVDLLGDGKAGILVQPGDASALESALAKLLSDARLRSELGARVRCRAVANFSLAAATSELIKVYTSLECHRKQ